MGLVQGHFNDWGFRLALLFSSGIILTFDIGESYTLKIFSLTLNPKPSCPQSNGQDSVTCPVALLQAPFYFFFPGVEILRHCIFFGHPRTLWLLFLSSHSRNSPCLAAVFCLPQDTSASCFWYLHNLRGPSKVKYVIFGRNPVLFYLIDQTSIWLITCQ